MRAKVQSPLTGEVFVISPGHCDFESLYQFTHSLIPTYSPQKGAYMGFDPSDPVEFADMVSHLRGAGWIVLEKDIQRPPPLPTVGNPGAW